MQVGRNRSHEFVTSPFCPVTVYKFSVDCRVSTFSLSQSATGVCGGASSRRASGGITPGKFGNSVCDLVHFDAIWWQLFVGRRTRYICNFAIKIEPICQLQCPRDCTAVLSLLSNEHALKSGTFCVPGVVLWGAEPHGTNPGHPAGEIREG